MRGLTKVLLINILLFNVGCILTRAQIKNKEEKKEISNKLTNLQRKNADDEVKLQEVESQVRELLGRAEVLEKTIQDKKTETESVQKSNSEKFKIYEEAILKVEKDQQLVNQNIDELKTMILSLAKNIEELKKEKIKKVKAIRIPKGNYKSAEYYFSKKKWKMAIKGFQKYRELNPKGKRYKVSTYKIGVCFEELNLKTEAKLFYDEVIQKYKSSKEAKKAKHRLNKIK